MRSNQCGQTQTNGVRLDWLDARVLTSRDRNGQLASIESDPFDPVESDPFDLGRCASRERGAPPYGEQASAEARAPAFTHHPHAPTNQWGQTRLQPMGSGSIEWTRGC